jgi:enoyl-CoA hydratase/carnithine racemase
MTDEVIISRTDSVLEIRMNRPAKKNALTRAMYAAMAGGLKDAAADQEIRAVVLSAEGDMFTAGNDISDFQAISTGTPAANSDAVGEFLHALVGAEKPVIAAVSGSGVGIGLTMLLHCDIVVMADDAQLVAPFTQLGLVPEAASSLLLPTLVGHKKAFMILGLGQPVGAAEAVELGIASFIAPRGEVHEHALKAAQQCAARPPEALQITKRLLRNKEPAIERLETERKYFAERLKSPEARAAFAAFLKR